MDSTEHVLVVPTPVFHGLGHFQGFTREIGRYLPELTQPRHVSYRPRHEVEEDPGYKQLIPYVIFRHLRGGRTTLFAYTRGSGQGEGRLHRKRSVGIGGHISSGDAATPGANVYEEGLRRELREEVIIDTAVRESCVGLINDDETPVGQVHLGVVHIFDVETPSVQPREQEMFECGFQPVEELLKDLPAFETWSQICLRALFAS
jgi:predicted NUDIX family phosphoesterase